MNLSILIPNPIALELQITKEYNLEIEHIEQ